MTAEVDKLQRQIEAERDRGERMQVVIASMMSANELQREAAALQGKAQKHLLDCITKLLEGI